MPSVSVVTATYNRAHLIGDTIRSVLNQSFRDLEYIIADDGSDDNTAGIVKSFADPRIVYFKLPHTGRLSSLRNFCHSKCTGEFIAYVDSDDVWMPDKVGKQVKALRQNPAAGFSFTDIEIFNEQGIIQPSLYKRQGLEVRNVFSQLLDNELVICHTTLMIRRSVLDTVGENDESFLSGDHDLVFRMSRETDAAIHYEPLVKVRRHAQNTSHGEAYRREGFDEHHRTLKKLLELRKITKEEYAEAINTTSYAFASQCMAHNDHDLALHYLKKSLAGNPWHPKAWFRMVLALAKKVLGF